MNTNTFLTNVYTEVEYIESSGTQYIDKQVLSSANVEINVAFSILDTSYKNNYIFGVYDGNYNRMQYKYVFPNFCGYGDVYDYNVLISDIDTNKHTINLKNGVFTLDEHVIKTINTNNFQSSSSNIFLASINSSGIANRLSSIRIYDCQIYNNSVLIRDFIPCYRNSDNEVGLYDLVNNVFYTNQGTGSFTYSQKTGILRSDKQALINNTCTIPVKILTKDDNENIIELTEHDIVNFDYEDYRYVDDDSIVIGQFVARKVTGELRNRNLNLEIEDKDIEVQLGIKTSGGTNYYSLGNFLITKPSNDDVKDKTFFESMDYTKKFNKPFDSTSLPFPCTALQLAQEVCRQADVELATLDFTNYDFIIEKNPYVEGEYLRKVMQDIGKLAYSWIRIGWDNKCYIDFEVKTTVDTYDTITNRNYYDLSTQNKYIGPVNRVIVGMKDIEGENVVIEDPESIEEYGVTEIRIYDNELTYTPELRRQVINSATRLYGLKYLPMELNTTGHPWLIGNELIEVVDMEGNSLYTYPFDRTIAYQGHIKTKLTSKGSTKTETEYRSYDNVETELRKTRIIADKNAGDLILLTQRTNTIQNSLDNDYYTSERVNQLIQNAETGVTNTFSTSGGNNIFRNTGLWFTTNDSNNPYEFWSGIVVRTKEENASNSSALLLQNGILEQEQLVPNGNYTVSFRYKKLIQLADIKVIVNDNEYALTEDEDTEFTETIEVTSQHINVKFESDINNSCEVYDLMVNAGSVKFAYSQNQNETTTDTVNISKGITITSSDTDTTFKANADGIRTLDKNGNELTKFTDTGMTTKKMIVEDTSQIVGMLIQEVGEQTWFTKL